jgi:hypothetical protein
MFCHLLAALPTYLPNPTTCCTQIMNMKPHPILSLPTAYLN